MRPRGAEHFRLSDTRGKQRNHKSPSRAHVTACQPWLLAELDAVRPSGVVLLGATGGQSVYGASFRVGASRGQVLEWPDDLGHAPAWVVPTVHPSSILRCRQRSEDLDAFVADLRVAAALLRS